MKRFFIFHIVLFSVSGMAFSQKNRVNDASVILPKFENFIATDVSSSEISLSWDNSFKDVDAIQIERSESGGPFEVIAEVGSTFSYYTDYNVSSGTAYTYRLQTRNKTKASKCSDVLYVGTKSSQLMPLVPTGISLIFASSDAISFEWDADRENVSNSVIVERSESGGSFEEIAEVSNSFSYFTDYNVSSETTYTYRLKAKNKAGVSEYSDELEISFEKEIEEVANKKGVLKNSDEYSNNSESDASESVCKIYPTVTADNITIEIATSEMINAMATIVSTNGNIVMSQILDAPISILDLSALSAGIYEVVVSQLNSTLHYTIIVE